MEGYRFGWPQGPPPRFHRRLLRRPLDLLRVLTFDVHELSGTARTSGREVRLLFITNYGIDAYVPGRVFASLPEPRRTGRVLLGAVRRFAERQSRRFHGVFLEVYAPFRRLVRPEGSVLLPHFVRQVLDLDGPLPVLERRFSRSLRRNLRRILDSGYVPDVRTDEEALRRFYDGMYRPTMQDRHGRWAETVSFEYCRNALRRGEIVFIRRDGRLVGGGLNELRGNTYISRVEGFADGDRRHQREGAALAPLYFGLRRAVEMGAAVFDLGSSRPFFADGVFFHKQRWGSRPTPDDRVPFFTYVIPDRTRADSESFQAIDPALCVVGEKLEKTYLWGNARAARAGCGRAGPGDSTRGGDAEPGEPALFTVGRQGPR